MARDTNRKLILAGLFVALGLIIPYFTGHAFGVPGTVLLPMHIPVLLCGLVCGPKLGALAGLLTPVLSSVLTGMPPAFPVLPMMAGELMTYGLVSGLIRTRFTRAVYPSLVGGMMAGRVVYGLIFAALVLGTNGAFQGASVFAAVSMGLPGIVLQLILIPPIVLGIERLLGMETNRKEQAELLFAGRAYEEAQDAIAKEGTSVVLIRNGEIIHRADGRGVSPLIAIYEEEPTLFKDVLVVDRLIGKAAAMILVKGGAKAAYANTMSKAGEAFLQKNGVQIQAGRVIDLISNRDNTGICPMERSVMHTEDPDEGYALLQETIQQLRKAN